MSDANVREFPKINSLTIGLDISRELRRERITRRLHERLSLGMIDEVRAILDSGVAPEDLIYYGLEYKYLTLYVIGELNYKEMVDQLEIAIHQFAKRQMTYFRGMERRGVPIRWIDTSLPTEEKVELIEQLIQ
jgi:tRNA dimethylallyltransferase